ncbi:hypothetical protein JNW88_08190 [Micromonospora sp. ATA32]|nr:hypothetical protein [Micromonospora sp. ATA32]
MAEQTDAARLAEANDIIIGAVENGPWVLIADPALRQLVGEYVAETCHSIAAAAGLDEAMERAHDAMPQRLGTSLPGGRVQCAATYPAAPEHDRRCVQLDDHVKSSPLHFNRAGFAWSDGEVLSAVLVDARERLAQHLYASSRYGTCGPTWEQISEGGRNVYRLQADELTTVIAGQETARG